MSKPAEYLGRLKDRVQLLRERASTTQLGDPQEITKELHALEWAIRTLEQWREHQAIMREVAKPDALLVQLTMHQGGKVWGSKYILDTARFGRNTVLGIKAVGLSAEAQATKLFETMAGKPE